MKYITYIDNNRFKKFVIFDRLTNHSDMYKNLGNVEVLGAGFIGFSNNRIFCGGESVSMNKKSRGEEDSRLIQKIGYEL